MNQDNVSQSDQPALSGIHHGLGSPQSVHRGHRHQEQSRNEQPFFLNGHFTSMTGHGNRVSQTPVTRTPQARIYNNRNHGLSPLAELPLPFGDSFGAGDIPNRSPMRAAGTFRDHVFTRTSHQVIVPLERNANFVNHDFNNGVRMIGPIRSQSRNLTMHDTIVAPSTERKTEKVCFNLKKINLFKTKIPTEPVKREQIDHYEITPTMVAPKIAKQKCKIKKGEKRSRKARSRVVTSKLPKIFCYCKKSNCKKEYCNCFKNKVACNSKCGCSDCTNDDAFYASMKQPAAPVFPTGSRVVQTGNAYRTVLAEEGPSDSRGGDPLASSRGCNCRKSFCQKKYCDCFSQGRKCSPSCHCDGCSNR